FKAGFFRRLIAKFGLLSERYPSATLEHVLESYLGERKLSQLLKPCIVTAYNIELRKTHFFRQQTAITRGDPRDFYLRDVCRATSAAQTYFSVAEIRSLSGSRYSLLDVGVFAPNPSMCALVDVTRAFIQTKNNDICILSMGTWLSHK